MKKVIVLSILMYSCGKIQRVDTTAVKEHMSEYKVVQIKSEDIVNKASELGKEIGQKFNGDLNIECVDKLKIENQEVELLDLSLEIEKTGKVAEILEAYKYGLEHNEAIGDNIQSINDTLFLYTFLINEKSKVKIDCKKDLGLVFLSKSQLIKSIKK